MPWAWPGLPLPKRLLSWMRSAVLTFRTVRSLRNTTVIVMEPPVFAPLTAWLALRDGCRLFLDLHSGALIAPNWRWARPLLRFVARRADGIIVTNSETLDGFDHGDTAAYVLHDPLWARPQAPNVVQGFDPGAYVLFPASANPDEPLELVERVGRLLNGDPVIKVTGRIDRPSTPGVEYVGFLQQGDYERLLRGATAVLSLTQWEATMQRSAYEAVTAGVPVVALDRRVLRENFDGAGAVFSLAEPDAIRDAIRYAVQHRTELADATQLARQRMQAGSDVVKEILLGTA